MINAQFSENFILHHIAFGRYGRSKGAFWAPKNSIFLKSCQICRELTKLKIGIDLTLILLMFWHHFINVYRYCNLKDSVYLSKGKND